VITNVYIEVEESGVRKREREGREGGISKSPNTSAIAQGWGVVVIVCIHFLGVTVLLPILDKCIPCINYNFKDQHLLPRTSSVTTTNL
jgi:hypothetical protein